MTSISLPACLPDIWFSSLHQRCSLSLPSRGSFIPSSTRINHHRLPCSVSKTIYSDLRFNASRWGRSMDIITVMLYSKALPVVIYCQTSENVSKTHVLQKWISNCGAGATCAITQPPIPLIYSSVPHKAIIIYRFHRISLPTSFFKHFRIAPFRVKVPGDNIKPHPRLVRK